MISIKEYAQNNNISYEAVRQQVARYRTELGDHVVRDGRQQFLDDEAVAFLDERRQKNPIVIYQASKDEEIERLHGENEGLLRELNAAKDRIIAQQDRLFELASADQKIQLLEARSEEETRKSAVLEAENAAAAKRIAESAQRIAEAESAAETSRCIAEAADQERERAEARAEAAERQAADLQAQLDRLAVAGFFERRRILKDLKRNGGGT